MYNSYLEIICNQKPDATAYIRGSDKYPLLRGKAEFFALREGVLVQTEVYGLPGNASMPFKVFAYHIHEGISCAGKPDMPFADTGGHFNPGNMPHPYHAGDLPPLFSNYGFAWNVVFTARFKLNDIIGRTIIIHSNADDFTTQPSGASGEKIACGVIQVINKYVSHSSGFMVCQSL